MANPFDDIFGSSGPQWTRDQIIARIRGEADAQKVDPDLALAVAMQESSLKPDNHGDNGKSRGLFHLQEKAAIDAGINPAWRDDPGVNIYGGVKYLKQQLDKSKGNVEQALSRYNRGTPDYQGIGDPNYVNHVLRHYSPQGALAKQQPTLLQQAAKFIQPASAEAATPAQAQVASSPVWDDIFGAAPQAAPAAQPTPPTARSTPEQDAAYRASVGQKEPATAPQPAPRSRLEELEAELARRDAQQATGGTPAGGWQADIFGKTPQATGAASAPAEEPITPERRFLDLPSSRQMSLEDRTQRFTEFYRLKPALKEEFLRSEEPPSDITVDIEKPSPPAPTGWRAQLPQTTEEWDKRMAPMRETTEATSRAAIPMALSAVPGGLAYTLGTKIAPALGAVGKVVPPLLEAAGGYLGHRANVALGHEKEGPLGDVLSALPLAVRALGSGTAGWLERTIKDAPVAARDQTMDLLSKLFSRGGAQGTLTYLLSGDPQLAAWVGGSYATVRSLLGFALRSDAGKQLVETTLKAGRAIGGAELGMLLQIGRTGKAPKPEQGESPAP